MHQVRMDKPQTRKARDLCNKHKHDLPGIVSPHPILREKRVSKQAEERDTKNGAKIPQNKQNKYKKNHI